MSNPLPCLRFWTSAPPLQEVDACKEFAFDDDAFFAVPDIDLPGSAADDGPAKSVLGKTFISDEFDVRAPTLPP